MALFKRTIADDARDFYQGGQSEKAHLCVHVYLNSRFKQVFAGPEFNGFSEGFSDILAMQVGHYLLGGDLESFDGVKPDLLEDVRTARRHVPQWADDVMGMSPELRELAIQTLRMHLSFMSYQHGEDWINTNAQGRRISAILMKYGDSVSESLTPSQFKALLNRWDTLLLRTA
jgi:hypothetical protein